jgi:hypothetical protein
MEGFKNLGTVVEFSEGEKISHMDPEREKDHIFDILVMNEIVSAFSDDLADAGFEDYQIKEFEKQIESLEEEQIKSVLATPRELRVRNFPKYFELVNSGSKTIEDIVKEITQHAQRKSYTLGYHVSNSEILRNGDEWVVNGKEVDDRDDRAMAYYSLDYANIFKTHRCKFLYVIRAQTGEDTDHKRDTSNNWGRASTLPIVHQLDLLKINEQVEEVYRSEKQEESEIVTEKSAA